MKALILSGGGARGAYQAGVLMAIGEIAGKLNIKTPFKIYTGISAGAINAAFLASGADDFNACTNRLAELWGNLHSDKVFKTDAITLGKIGLQWVGELSFGGLSNSTHGKSLLDTTPLADLIRNNLDFSKIRENIKNSVIYSVAVTALDYRTSTTITFVEGAHGVPMWQRNRRRSEVATLQTEHIVGSSAIPLLFMPSKIGDRFYGDGCVRNQTSLSPAIHMGADQLMVIGVRKQGSTNYDTKTMRDDSAPSVARVVNELLNSVLLDGVETDIERLNRINEFLDRVPKQHHEALNFKKVEHVWIHPSEDIGQIASSMAAKLPRIIRYLLKGLGPLDDASEIISYLLFEPEFCGRLIEIGYQDGKRQEQEIEKFLLS